MADQDIEVKIAPDGTIEIDMSGYKGTTCEQELKKMLRSGMQLQRSTKKQDYYGDDPKVHITE